jgi:predicted DNA-binding transcriptional regulator AlpA
MGNTNPSQAAVTETVEPLWDKVRTAKFLGISVKTLDRWLAENRGPRGRRVGAQIRYTPGDVAAYLESCASVGGGAAA